MSRMTVSLMLGLLALSTTLASDVNNYRPGYKPFCPPRAPQPTGVLSACFGFHATRWTPWQASCGDTQPTAPPPGGQSCNTSNSKAIVLFENAPAPATAPQAMPAPAAGSVKPMPPVKK